MNLQKPLHAARSTFVAFGGSHETRHICIEGHSCKNECRQLLNLTNLDLAIVRAITGEQILDV